MDWSNNWLVQATIIGILLGIGFTVPALWPLGLLGVAGVLYFFIHTDASLLQAWFIFWVKSLFVGVWIWSVYPIDWLGFSLGWVELPIIALYWTTISAALALGGTSLLIMVSIFRKYLSLTWLYVVAPFLWLVAELLQSLVFSTFLYGPGGQIGANYSMGYIGYILAEHNVLIQLAGIGGVYSLGLVTVALSAILLQMFLQQRYTLLGVFVSLLIISSVWPTQSPTATSSTLTVATIDTQTPSETESDPAIMHASISDALEAAKNIDPDYILLPEDSRYFDQSLDTQTLKALLAFWQSDTRAVIVDSGRVKLKDDFVLQAAIYDGQTKELFQSQKRYLVPQGEFMPYGYSFLFSLIGQSESSKLLQERLSYRVGPDTGQAHFTDRIPAVLFCFEVVDPQGVRKVLRERSGSVPFVAHVISHAWIHPSRIFRHQLESQLRVQAIWNDTYIVSAGNHLSGYTVSPAGDVLHPTVIDEGEYWKLGVIEIPVRE